MIQLIDQARAAMGAPEIDSPAEYARDFERMVQTVGELMAPATTAETLSAKALYATGETPPTLSEVLHDLAQIPSIILPE